MTFTFNYTTFADTESLLLTEIGFGSERIERIAEATSIKADRQLLFFIEKEQLP